MVTEQAAIKADANNSPAEKPNLEKVYTEAEVRKLRSDLLAEVGQHKASSERALKSAQAALDQVARWEQSQQEAELEAHKDEPSELRRIRAEQDARQAKANLANREQELQEEREKRTRIEAEHSNLTKTETARDIASSLNVDANRLVKLAKYTDGSREAIEDIAKDLPKIVSSSQGGGRPDSNQSRGGGSGRKPTTEELAASTPFETAAKIKSGEWVVRGWTP